MLDGMDQFDNEYGRTYSYYVPVYIDGEETAMACMDMDMDFIDSNIMKNVIQLVGVIGVVMIAGFLLTFILNRRYTSKIKIIVGHMQYYIKSKDASIAEIMNKTEISAIMEQIDICKLEVNSIFFPKQFSNNVK